MQTVWEIGRGIDRKNVIQQLLPFLRYKPWGMDGETENPIQPTPCAQGMIAFQISNKPFHSNSSVNGSVAFE